MAYGSKVYELAKTMLEDNDTYQQGSALEKKEWKEELAQSLQDYLEDWIQMEVEKK